MFFILVNATADHVIQTAQGQSSFIYASIHLEGAMSWRKCQLIRTKTGFDVDVFPVQADTKFSHKYIQIVHIQNKIKTFCKVIILAF